MQITYGLIAVYSLLITFLPRVVVFYKEQLKDIGISIQLIVYILFFEILHILIKKYKRLLIRRVGYLTINALITYTYCCVVIAIFVGNDVEWSRLFKAF